MYNNKYLLIKIRRYIAEILKVIYSHKSVYRNIYSYISYFGIIDITTEGLMGGRLVSR